MEKGTSTDPLFTGESISYHLKSAAKKMDISFMHVSFNTDEMVKRNMVPDWDSKMEIKTVDNNIASTQTVYNLDAYFKAYTRQQLIDWFDSLGVNDKKIYFFDQRDLAKGKVTLIQVGLLSYGFSDDIIIKDE